MIQEDWFKKGITEYRVPEKIMVMWKPILWCAENVDLVLKVMGKTVSSKEEQIAIEKKLDQEHQYELLVAMIYAKSMQRQHEMGSGREEFQLMQEEELERKFDSKIFYKKRESEQGVFLLPYYQLLSFSRWCDKKDWEAMFEKPSIWEWYRLCYLALMVGYQSLAFYFVQRMEKQIEEEESAILKENERKVRLLQRKWILDFYQKQPEGKEKKRLAKRILRYGIGS